EILKGINRTRVIPFFFILITTHRQPVFSVIPAEAGIQTNSQNRYLSACFPASFEC
ncbi:MAG: hypothetical protein ACD_23C00588G0002, partial [uncultured bacterium]